MSAAPKIEQPIVSIVSSSQLMHFTGTDITVKVDNRRYGLRALWTVFLLWCEKRNGRRTLRDLTDDQLRDIGLSRAEANKEVGKSYFWN